MSYHAIDTVPTVVLRPSCQGLGLVLVGQAEPGATGKAARGAA